MSKKRGLVFVLIFFLRFVNDAYIKKFFRGSFSQKGEDLVIEKIIGNKKTGFYVDVGAHNPDIYNNTKRFYMKGWRGINIEPNPILFKKFNSERKRDINLNIGIRKKEGQSTFYDFEVDALSTFSWEEKNGNLKLGYKLNHELKVPVKSLRNVIGKYCKNKIDFISVDTEGLDLEVLESNDWKNFRPKAVCVETGDFNSTVTGKKSDKKNMIDSFMVKNKYTEYFDNGLNTIYLDNLKNNS